MAAPIWQRGALTACCDKLAHAPDPFEAALEVAGPTSAEIAHRQSQQLAHEEIEGSASMRTAAKLSR
jgi:hypothetical protein